MIPNMRDLGGICTKDGRRIRQGTLIRSGQLSQAEESDLVGVSAIIDLRTSEEQREAPDRTHGRQYLPLPIFEGAIPGVSHEQNSESSALPDMPAVYRQTAIECAESFGRVLRSVMEHDFSRGAILWHCTEGKDRCGITTALILEALGIEWNDILEDYLKTNETNIPKAEAVRAQLTPVYGAAFSESVYRAYIADEKYLLAAWEGMGTNYITGKLCIPEETLNAFRQTVLEGV